MKKALSVVLFFCLGAVADPIKDRLIRAAGRVMQESERFTLVMKERAGYDSVVLPAQAMEKASTEFYQVLYRNEDPKPYYQELRVKWASVESAFANAHKRRGRGGDDKALQAFKELHYDVGRLHVLMSPTKF
jgi:hypothetical protein